MLLLPCPISFFLAYICLYFLTLVLHINPWVEMMEALAYAYSTFDPIIISVGHETQMLANSFAAAIFESLLLIFQRKNLPGAALMWVFFRLQLNMTTITEYRNNNGLFTK